MSKEDVQIKEKEKSFKNKIKEREEALLEIDKSAGDDLQLS